MGLTKLGKKISIRITIESRICINLLPYAPDEVVLFVNAGSETMVELDSNINFVADKYFEGGDELQTNESITEGGDVPFIYQTARLGNFQYLFNNLPEGNYYIDLHFVEMINTFGPKGMRVFNVYLQEEKASFTIPSKNITN